ncbi:MAG: GatB/YqeY domain-containing protein [Methylacidiphilales bacterium]|nr:GatB/YqeY domain-containing protein [Candidatus Methylacidiphilales bacterium]
MSLLAKIDADLKAAMIARQADKLSVLRMLKSAVKYASIEKGGADFVPTDVEVLAVVRKEVKKREDSIASYIQAARTDLADKEKAELEFLRTFLPAQLSPEKIEALVKEAIAEVGATSKAQMGAVMKAAQAKAAGQADGKTLSQVVQRLLP